MARIVTAIGILVAVSVVPTACRLLSSAVEAGGDRGDRVLPFCNDITPRIIVGTASSDTGSASTSVMGYSLLPNSVFGKSRIAEAPDESLQRLIANRRTNSEEDRMALLAGAVLAGAWLIAVALQGPAASNRSAERFRTDGPIGPPVELHASTGK